MCLTVVYVFKLKMYNVARLVLVKIIFFNTIFYWKTLKTNFLIFVEIFPDCVILHDNVYRRAFELVTRYYQLGIYDNASRGHKEIT